MHEIPLTEKISKAVEKISMKLMRMEEKDFCIAGVSPLDWRIFHNDDDSERYILVPSMAFKRLVLERGYLQAVQSYPDKFGTGKTEDVLKALCEKAKPAFPLNTETEDYGKYLSQECMAYIFRVKDNEIDMSRVLRLDLFRDYDDKDFRGGLFHSLKHFSIEGESSISQKSKREYERSSWNSIYTTVIKNFFSGEMTPSDKRDNAYIANSKDRDGNNVSGVYYRHPDLPCFFLDSIHRTK